MCPLILVSILYETPLASTDVCILVIIRVLPGPVGLRSEPAHCTWHAEFAVTHSPGFVNLDLTDLAEPPSAVVPHVMTAHATNISC